MMKTIGIWLAAALSLGAAATAAADTYRVPKTGAPALTATLPSGWSGGYDAAGNLHLTPDDHSGAVMLSMTTDPSVAGVPVPTLAAGVFKAIGAPPYSATAPASLAGIAGSAFAGSFTNSAGVVLDVRLVIAKLDGSHQAFLLTLKPHGQADAQATAVDTLGASIGLDTTAAPAPAPTPASPSPPASHAAADAAGL